MVTLIERTKKTKKKNTEKIPLLSRSGEQLNSSEAYVSHLKEKQHFGVERDAAFWKDDE